MQTETTLTSLLFKMPIKTICYILSSCLLENLGLLLSNSSYTVRCICIRAAASENQQSACAKTKPQISCAVTAQQISAFVFATWIVQFLFYLLQILQLLALFFDCTSPLGRNPAGNTNCWFSHAVDQYYYAITNEKCRFLS